jgi:ApaG protein
MIETGITRGIKITVEPFYIESHSRPMQNHFAHGYRVTIENQSDEIVQLMRRHWFIYDGANEVREVEGAGVLGEQPTLAPGQFHRYTSWCPMTTEVGKMHGMFKMQTAKKRKEFKVDVPVFQLIAPSILN